MSPALADVAVGTELPEQVFRITRADLVRYAGASGDFNPIHWNDRVATAVGLPGVIAHGMFTMALAARAVTGWTGDRAPSWSTTSASAGPSSSPTTTPVRR